MFGCLATFRVSSAQLRLFHVKLLIRPANQQRGRYAQVVRTRIVQLAIRTDLHIGPNIEDGAFFRRLQPTLWLNEIQVTECF